MTANGDVQSKIRSHSVCQRTGPIRDGDASWRNSRSSLHSVKLCEDHGTYLPLDQRSKTRISPKMAKESIAIFRTTYHSLSLVYRRSSSNSSSHDYSTSSSQDSAISTENPAQEERSRKACYGVTRCMGQQRQKTQIKMTTTKCGVNFVNSIGATDKPVAWTSWHFQFFSWITNEAASKSGSWFGHA